MKTAISIDAPLLEEADRTAQKLGVSRSRLMSLALTDYLRKRRNEDILEQLNQVYGDSTRDPERPSGAQSKAKLRSTIKDRW